MAENMTVLLKVLSLSLSPFPPTLSLSLLPAPDPQVALAVIQGEMFNMETRLVLGINLNF